LVARGFGADGNGDGSIDNTDYQLWRSNFGSTPGSASAADLTQSIPEPNSLILWLFSGAPFLAQIRGRRMPKLAPSELCKLQTAG
jgi:hypothetical protein